MYLRQKNFLKLRTIAEEWAKERPSRDTRADVLSEFLQAFFRGHLTSLRLFPGEPAFTLDQALRLLVRYGEQDPHPGILISGSKEELENMIVQHPDGSVDVDTRAAIYLPTDRGKWSKRIREDAINTLSDLKTSAYSINFLADFGMLQIEKLDFLDYLRACGLEPLAFWYYPDNPLRGIPPTRLRRPAPTDTCSAKPKRGAPFKYDYGPIDAVLDEVRRKDGFSAFTDRTALYSHVKDELGEDNVPKRSAFHKHLKEYIAKNFDG